MFKLENKLGDIVFSETIINRIVTEAVESCEGKAEILNYKGKYKNMVPGIASKMNLYDEESGGIQLIKDEDGLQIKVYIIIHLGASIKETTEKIISYIYEYVEKMLNERPKSVTVTVTGILSKNMVKRHIEVSR